MKTSPCLLLCLLLLCSGQLSAQSAGNDVFTIAERMPAFPGGNDSLAHYMADNVLYPDDAIEGNIQGKVYVQFIVDTGGNITNPRIIKSVHPLLDSAAIAVVRYMPQWTPGENGDHKVPVYVKLPVIFHLEADEEGKTTAHSKGKSATKPRTKLTVR